MSETIDLAKLRAPFPPNQISKLPKESRAQIDARKGNSSVMVFNCQVCGGHHHKDAVHLDYVGHAALTDRLLDTDIAWSWEPMAFDEVGMPVFDRNNGLWIRLTVGSVTRLGYGSADGKSGGDAVKEIIGDALRNAAMRFGAALDLWHKGDLHVDDEPAKPANEIAPRTKLEGPYTSKTALWKAVKEWDRECRSIGDIDALTAFTNTPETVALFGQLERDAPQLLYGGEGVPDEFEPLQTLVNRMSNELGVI